MLQAASVHKELVLWLGTSNPSDRPKQALTQSGGRAVTGAPSCFRIFDPLRQKQTGTSFSDTLLGFTLLGYPPIVARISIVRLSKSSYKT
jgi:hypothetical protein